MNRTQIIKILKTSLYVGLSAGLGAIIAYLQNHAELFGIYAPIINILLVSIRQLMKGEE